MTSKPKTVSLVLGSGGARGHAHIGVIRALEEMGFEILNISGTSMGAVVGGVYAANELDTYTDWAFSLGMLSGYWTSRFRGNRSSKVNVSSKP